MAIPGLGHVRFGIRANSVKNVEDVGTDLIRTRRVLFLPSMDIRNELASTKISITCYDIDGKVVKTVTSKDNQEVEEIDEEDNGVDETENEIPADNQEPDEE